MTRTIALLRCERGSALIEFALLVPAFLTGIFGIIEVSRLLWTQQTLDEVAFATARCISISSSCDTVSAQKTFAVDRAGSSGIVIGAADVTVASDTTCKGFPDSSSVTITTGFDSVLASLVPQMAASTTSSACFPEIA